MNAHDLLYIAIALASFLLLDGLVALLDEQSPDARR
jgi:hypothetical protein